MNQDFNDQLEILVRDTDYKIAKDRMKWPNPNPDEDLEEIWSKYETAWARAVFSPSEPTEAGLSAQDELVYWWNKYQEAVMKENEQ
jgi:hypothetical protein